MPATKIDPDKVYVCMDSFMSGPMAAVANEGDELRGSDPRVQAAPHLFAPAGTPRSEWTTGPFHRVNAETDARSAALAEERQAAFDRRAKANSVKLEQPKYVFLKKEYTGTFEGQPATLKRGSALPESHPFVQENRDLFG